MDEHAERWRVANELHARPFIATAAPFTLVHLCIVHADEGADAARSRLSEICQAEGVDPVREGSNHFSGTLGSVHLKWESHTEFSSWTLWREVGDVAPFAGYDGAGDVGVDWLDSLPGELLVAVRVHALDAMAQPVEEGLLEASFQTASLCGAVLGQTETTQVWTDFRPDAAGYLRILVHDHGSDPRKLGRRVQRLLEIETYRSMALLALPVAQAAAPRVDALESRLAQITKNLQILEDLEAEQRLLAQMMKLSAESEELSATTAFRFSAAEAYFEIVRERVVRLDERRLGELPTIAGFFDRRLSPAMRTCVAARMRQEAVAERVARAANLLRTRVDLALEAQNRSLLESMERRARLQVRLQQTVEGLSVAAITYYVVSLVAYLAKAATRQGFTVDPDVVTGASVPVVALGIWWMVRRFKRRIERDER